ncbi:MAG: hypothetical protein ACNS60_05140 [Candidatus Cyclobacteriaceae bacterium M2_1C_046]
MKKIIRAFYIATALLSVYNQSFGQRICGTVFKKENLKEETRLQIDKFNERFNNKLNRTGPEGEISLLSTNFGSKRFYLFRLLFM